MFRPRYTRGASFILFAILAAEAHLASAEIVVITASRDNTLFEDPLGGLSSGAGPSIFAGNNSTRNIRRALVYFDVAGIIPANASIDSVEVRLYVSNAPNDVPQVFSIHRILVDWGEGSSVSSGGGGAPATANDATWLHRFYPSSLWSNAGGDFDASTHAWATVGGVGEWSWADEHLTADVRAWYDSPGDNFGWLVAGNESAASTVRRFESRETLNSDQRPRLIVHYSLPVPIWPATWGQIKNLYSSDR